MKCKVCGKEFTPKTSTHIYCSIECRKIRMKEKDKQYKRRIRKQGRTEHSDIKCKICGNEFTQKTSLENTCSDECKIEKNRQASKAYRRKIAKMKTPLVYPMIKCEECKKEFKTESKVKKYCTPECSELGRIRKAKEYHAQVYEKAKHETIECKVCGNAFIQKLKTQKYCANPECKQEGHVRNNISFHVSEKMKEFINGKDNKAKYLRGLVQRDMDESK